MPVIVATHKHSIVRRIQALRKILIMNFALSEEEISDEEYQSANDEFVRIVGDNFAETLSKISVRDHSSAEDMMKAATVSEKLADLYLRICREAGEEV